MAAKEGVKTNCHRKLLLCKTIYDFNRTELDPLSADNKHFNQLLKELKISSEFKSQTADRELLSKWWTDFSRVENVDVSQFDFRDGLNNNTEIHICVDKFLTLTAILRSSETRESDSV